MTDSVRVSVIVASRHRPEALRRCLTGLMQSDHANFEVIVVADPQAIRELPSDLPVRMAAFDAPNISAARNIGLDLAAGEILAFIDDDAVPEPTWLSRLVEPFRDDSIAATTGFVRGRNGIALQWQAHAVDRLGHDIPLDLQADDVVVPVVPLGCAVKLQGTNCAVRRYILAALGGFDETLHFYLDDADVALRLAKAGHRTAVVGAAQVHHGFSASERRRMGRAPLTLFDVGASSHVFLRRHAGQDDASMALKDLIRQQRCRALDYMRQGRLEPHEVAPLLRSLVAGIADGGTRPLPEIAPRLFQGNGFVRVPSSQRQGRILSGRAWSRGSLRRQARLHASRDIVTIFRFSPTALAHRMQFREDGYWEQTGGVFGRSNRQDAVWKGWTFATRLKREMARVARFRPVA